jgi:beta-glucosidase-like glycosyl hydrolase
MITKKLPVIFGVKSTSLSQEEREFFKKFPPMGFILFARNIESREQVKALTKELHDLSSDKLIMIDQEGGRVCRLKFPLFRECPSAKFFGDMYQELSREKALRSVYSNYYKLMQGLLELGINVNTVPVADLIHPGANEIVGNRSFSSEINIVVELCYAVTNATIDAGGYAVVKHIPGHGRAMLDSHAALPHIDTDLKTLAETDFSVFKRLSSLAESEKMFGMSAHIIYKSLDAENPATLSPKVMQYIRDEIGFHWNIMTDDICMKALNGDYALIAQAAIAAGCNIVLHCSGELEEMYQVAEGLLKVMIQELPLPPHPLPWYNFQP